ncbi:MAG: cytidylyltransferase domain-containing protein [Cyanobacteriota bacterium]
MTEQQSLVGLVALLPLRGGSKGIPGKNIRDLNGQPLYSWCAKAALEAGVRLVISTESEEIRQVVRSETPTAELLDRPEELADDTASTEAVIDHFLRHVSCDHVLLLQATSPLTQKGQIAGAIGAYVGGGCKPLVSGTRQHHFIWNEDGLPINYTPQKRPRRQDWGGTFVENGAIYLFSREVFQDTGCRCRPPCTLYIMPTDHATELDTLDDWRRLELHMTQ